MNLKELIREIPDFPVSGISFKDITTLLKNKIALHEVIESFKNHFDNNKITKVIGIEARGFILGGAIANELNAGFVPVRKQGKLPDKTFTAKYALEYGTDSIEIHQDAILKEDIVLVHDDLLATGGTALAVLNMLKTIGVKNIYFCFICDLKFIQSANKDIIYNYDPFILVKYSE